MNQTEAGKGMYKCMFQNNLAWDTKLSKRF